MSKKGMKGIFGFTAPGKGGKGGKGSKGAPSTSAAGEIMAPPAMRKKPGTSKGMSSRTNNDGDLFTRQSPYKRPRYRPPF